MKLYDLCNKHAYLEDTKGIKNHLNKLKINKQKLREINVVITNHFITRFNERFDKENKILDVCEYLNKNIEECSFVNNSSFYGLYIENAGAYVPLVKEDDKYIATTFKFSRLYFNNNSKQVRVKWMYNGDLMDEEKKY